MFGVSSKQMAWLCHTMHTMLDAGLPMTRTLDVLTAQAPSSRLRSGLARARRAVDEGSSLAEALRAQGCFPELFLHLVEAGEDSGTLERVLAELARYYEFQHGLWRAFLARIAMPAFQYIAAVAVVSLALYLVNVLSGRPASLAPGFLLGYGWPAAIIGIYYFLLKPMGGTRPVHEAALRLPVLSAVVRNLALSRFSLVMGLMMEAGVPVKQSLLRSFTASGNAAFSARGPAAAEVVEKGGTLSDALDGTGLFPREYMDIVRVAEESGKLSERFQWLASHHADRAQFALGLLVRALAWLVWLMVAVVIVCFIFRFFSAYVGGLDRLLGLVTPLARADLTW
jgi:type II secretory pathway component PulF